MKTLYKICYSFANTCIKSLKFYNISPLIDIELLIGIV